MRKIIAATDMMLDVFCDHTTVLPDDALVRYTKTIELEDANKLLYDWQPKGKEIEDKARYCNAVLVRVGKAAMKANS